MKRRHLYLICYDIADPKRLNRVARYLVRCAYRVQYSVFAAQLTKSELNAVLTDLDVIIHPKQDDIRCYRLPSQGPVALLGNQLFPRDVLLLKDGHNILRLSSNANDYSIALGRQLSFGD